ncbi:YqzG/YhdC family protein [Paenibacillus andongensis]|uniref:YqzG/YhdC family protein n=1 Tax=Paenibacillus andongensis TaxID=2975482 RepID=UPI0021BAFA91|nr:YqzG/YhdC family protein [Paenibacillus andongensis]
MGRILAVLLIIWVGWSGSLQARTVGTEISSEISTEISTETSTEQIIVKHKPVKDPEYAKWSRLAFQEAGRLYTLLDYKYLGRSTIAPGVVQQQFRFWVRHHGVEFPLIVSIRYDPITEKVFTIDMEQEQRGNLPIL